MMKTRVIVSAIIEKDGKLLFGKKAPGIGPYPDTWHLLGGGIEQGESVIEALRREIAEESGIQIASIEPVSFDEDFEPDKHGETTHYIFLVFRAQYKSGKSEPKDDIVELKWIEKSTLPRIELNRPTTKLFKKMGYI